MLAMALPSTNHPSPLAGWLLTRSASELSRQSGVNVASISEWLRRKQRLTRESLDAISDATGVSVIDLLLWQEDLLGQPRKPKARRTKRAA